MPVIPAIPWTANSTVDYADQSNQDGLRPVSSYSEGFESMTLAVPPSGGNTMFTWADSNACGVSDAIASAGSKSIEFTFIGSVTDTVDAIAEQRFTLDKRYTELWLTYKLYIPANYTHDVPSDGAANNKGLINFWGGANGYSGYSPMISLHFVPPSDASLGVDSVTNANGSANYVAKRANQATSYNSYNKTDHTLDWWNTSNSMNLIDSADIGTWVTYIIHVKTATFDPPTHDITATADGVCEVWKNGTKIIDYHTLGNYFDGLSATPADASTEDGWDNGYILGAANSGFRVTTKMNIDEFKIGETMASIGVDVS